MKRRLRSCIDQVADWAGVLAAFERRMLRGVTVLMYHRVLPDAQCAEYPFHSLAMPASAFAAQVDWLSRHCRVMPVVEAIDAISGGSPHADAKSGRPIVCVTFDDGYRDNFDVAAPVLESAGVRGTFFITTHAVETQTLLWYDAAAIACLEGAAKGIAGSMDAWIESLKQAPAEQREAIVQNIATAAHASPRRSQFAMMTPDHVRTLAQRGHEIGSHTVTHPILPQLRDAQAASELMQSREALQAWTGMPVTGVAYPNGDHDDRIATLVAATGYAYACTTRPGMFEADHDPYRMPRMDITPQRVCDERGEHNERALRGEISQFREALR